MAKKLYEESDIQSIANAIRSKGVSGTMKVSQMADKVLSIPTGSGEEVVRDNGVYEKIGVSVPDNYGLHTVLTNATPESIKADFMYKGNPVSLYLDFTIAERDQYGYHVEPADASMGLYADYAKYGIAFYLWDYSTNAAIKTDVSYKISSTKPQRVNYKPADGFIRVQGKDLIDENGNVYVIRSVGTQGNDYNSVGNESKPNTWYMRNEAFAEMAQLGFNTTRFVFGYQIFESDDAPYEYMESGFQYLDTVIGYARTNGIKIILNLHSAQGGTQYSANGINLWLEPENQNRVVALWKEIARRYKDEPTILAYAPMNELHIPLYEDGWLSEAAVTYSNFYQRCIDAIREVDKNHIIVAERGLWTYPMYDISATYYNTDKCYIYYPMVRDNNLAFEWHYYKNRPTRNEDGTVTGTVDKDTMIESIELTNDLFRRLHGDIPLFFGEYGNLWSYDYNDELFLEWTRLVDEIAEERQYGRNLHTYYGWHRGTTLNSMGLRYASTWHGTWENTTLYESLANIYRNAVNTQPDPVEVLAVGWRKEVIESSSEPKVLRNPEGTMMEYLLMPAENGNPIIPDGYIRPEGTKVITENGTGIDVSAYAFVDVAVTQSGASGEGIQRYVSSAISADSRTITFAGLDHIPDRFFVMHNDIYGDNKAATKVVLAQKYDDTLPLAYFSWNSAVSGINLNTTAGNIEPRMTNGVFTLYSKYSALTFSDANYTLLVM